MRARRAPALPLPCCPCRCAPHLPTPRASLSSAATPSPAVRPSSAGRPPPDEPASDQPFVYLPAGLLRMLVGDHTGLLAFLGLSWPLGPVSNTLLQLACTVLVARQNEKICATPVRFRQLLPKGKQGGAPACPLAMPGQPASHPPTHPHPPPTHPLS